MFGNLFNNVVDLAEDIVKDPIGKTVDIATQPVVDALDVLEGITELELREKAALRLGTDVVAGMVLSEVIVFLTEEK